MRVKCIHGYFILNESRSGEISDFISYSGLNLKPKDEYFTFEALTEAPDFSLVGKSFLGFPAVANFAGKPWEVFEANGAIYDFNADLMRPIQAVTQKAKLTSAGNYYFSNGLMVPGSLVGPGQRVKGYTAWFSFDRLTWRYSEVTVG